MAELTRPDLPPGPLRELVDALHDLHHRAGWPSLRALAKEVGCSPTTVSLVFSSPRLPSWPVLELVVEALDGDVPYFHRVWLAASSPAAPAGTVVEIAGRRTELAAVRRHLESGRGLLLVTGEAGIGKTRLVDAAADSVREVFVARGGCLPLSAQVPLLAVTDALRCVHEIDHGQRLKETLADCPPYVGASLGRLVPELDDAYAGSAVPEDQWWQQRLFAAVGATFTTLADLDPTALLLEDLHWADSTTLDLLEHLLSRTPSFPLLATYRRSDPTTSAATRDWLRRIERLPAVTTLELGALTRDESAEQLQLLGLSVPPDEVDRIHQRSAGLPLFTEQLALSSDESSLPGPLADLLDSRIVDLADDEWAVTRALGVADRSLSAAQLRQITELTSHQLTAALHALDSRHLTTTDPTGDHDVRLRHPLLAEAVRRRLVAGEELDEHRRVALTLADGPEPSAAEVAEHWRLAADPEQELVWRIRAAQDAGARFAGVQAGEQWRRAFELWPAEAEYAGTPGVRRAEAYLAAIFAVEWTDWSAAAAVAEGALAAIGEPRDATEALAFSRIGTIRGDQGDPAAGLALVDRALAVLDPATHPAECAHALLGRQYLLRGLDRIEESDAAAARAVELTADTAPALHRRALAVNAGHDAGRSGRLEEALEGVQAAVRLVPEKPDPAGDLIVAGYHVLVLMCAGRGADEVVAAGRPGLESAAAWGLDKIQVLGLLDNMALALMWEGRVREAAEIIDPATEEPFTPMSWPLYVRRGVLDLLRGRADEATTLLDAVSEMFVMDVANRVERALAAPAADLWCGRPQRAYDRLISALNESLPIEDPAADIGGLLVLAARAAADMAAESRGDALLRATLAHELEDLMARAARDPFDGSGFHSDRPAQRVTWDAELARLSGSPSLERWAKAAAAWDELGRVHDSAYCRWRGAQAALGGGQGTTAARLLRRAERDAQEHVPLLDSIRATVTPMARV